MKANTKNQLFDDTISELGGVGTSIYLENDNIMMETDVDIPNDKDQLKTAIEERTAKTELMFKDFGIINLADLENKIIETKKIITKLTNEKVLGRVKNLKNELNDYLQIKNQIDIKLKFIEALRKLNREQADDVKRGKESNLWELIKKYELNKIDDFRYNDVLLKQDVQKVKQAITYTKNYLTQVKSHKRSEKIKIFEDELKDLLEIENLADVLKIIENFEAWIINFHNSLKKKMNIEFKDLAKTIIDKKAEVEIHKKLEKNVLAKEVEFYIEDLEEFREEAKFLGLIKSNELGAKPNIQKNPSIQVQQEIQDQRVDEDEIEDPFEGEDNVSSEDFFAKLNSEKKINSLSALKEAIVSLEKEIVLLKNDPKAKKKIPKKKTELNELQGFDVAAKKYEIEDREEEDFEEEVDIKTIMKECELTDISELPEYLDYFIEDIESKKKDLKAYKDGMTRVNELKAVIEKLLKKGVLKNGGTNNQNSPNNQTKQKSNVNNDEAIKDLKERMNDAGVESYQVILEAIQFTEEEIAQFEKNKDLKGKDTAKKELEKYMSLKKDAEELGLN